MSSELFDLETASIWGEVAAEIRRMRAATSIDDALAALAFLEADEPDDPRAHAAHALIRLALISMGASAARSTLVCPTRERRAHSARDEAAAAVDGFLAEVDELGRVAA